MTRYRNWPQSNWRKKPNEMHEDIERFTRSPIIIKDNKDMSRLKQMFVEDLEEEMRLLGVMRCMDIDPHWDTRYDDKDDLYICGLSLYGIHVGIDNCSPDERFYNGRKVKFK